MDPLILEKLIAKVGGRYKLTVLIQKRIRELMRNAPKLVDMESENPMHIAIEEIRQGKIDLVDEQEYFEYLRKTGGEEAIEEEKNLMIKTKPRTR